MSFSHKLCCLIQTLSFIALLSMTALSQENMGGRSGVEVRQSGDSTSKGSIRGRVVLANGKFAPENLKVSLLTYKGVESVGFTDARGGFDFQNLTPGNYEVQVETMGVEYQVVNQTVQVFRGMPAVITVTLPEKAAGAVTKAETVSVAELGADVPKNARKEFEAANKAAENNKREEAIEHLRRAIAIYPAFVMARNNLGVQLMALGKLDEAAEELQKTVDLDQKAFNPRLNLGIVLVELERFFEATLILDQAAALNPNSPAAQLYLGIAKLKLENLDEAEKHLKAAYTVGGSSYSIAQFHLGELYIHKGEREAAVRSLETYLRESPSAANAAQAKKLLATLK